MEKITPVIQKYSDLLKAGQTLDAKHRNYYNQLLAGKKEKQQRLDELSEEFRTLHKEMMNGRHAKITVYRDIHPGTVISFSDLTMTLKDKRSYCTIERKNGEIVFKNM
jgi:wobble nucleotide-excising tRNase